MLKIILSDEQIEIYAENYLEIPALTRKRNSFTFDTYINFRKMGFPHKFIEDFAK